MLEPHYMKSHFLSCDEFRIVLNVMVQLADRIFAIQKLFAQPQEGDKAWIGIFTDCADLISVVFNLLKFIICELC